MQTIETYKAPPAPATMVGGKETYEWRETTGKPNPPTLVDTFITDLWQRLNMDLKLEGLSENHVSEEQVMMALDVYLERDWRHIAGYRPWTHWNFVRSLSPQERRTLAQEVARYMKDNGVKDGL